MSIVLCIMSICKFTNGVDIIPTSTFVTKQSVCSYVKNISFQKESKEIAIVSFIRIIFHDCESQRVHVNIHQMY